MNNREVSDPSGHIEPEKTSYFLYAAANFPQLLAEGGTEAAAKAARLQHEVAEKSRTAKAHLNLGRIGSQGATT